MKAYFEKFLSLWPTVEDLARAENEDVMKAWAGLGYYARARNLKKCAEAVANSHGGRFPDTEEGLKSLPGIGDYTAAAIAAIAFNHKSAVLDGNVERVISRLYAIETPLPAAKPEMRARVAILTPDDRPGDFAQAMMDLGATICTPKRPACSLCPFRAHCRALSVADPETFPRKAQKKDKPLRCGAAFVAIDADNAVYLRKRVETGLLGGMTEVPGTDWTSRQDGDTSLASQPFVAPWEDCGTISHVFTHFELRLSVYRANVARAGTEGDGWWEPVHSLTAQALPEDGGASHQFVLHEQIFQPQPSHHFGTAVPQHQLGTGIEGCDDTSQIGGNDRHLSRGIQHTAQLPMGVAQLALADL
ncbi:Endonuclease III [compost metagenome]